MIVFCRKLLLTVLLFGITVTSPLAQDVVTADVCILGGSEAGFTAAIQSARMGKKTVLIEPTGHPGGMMVEGIVKDIRFGSAVVIGGLAREVYTAIEKRYGRVPAFDRPGWSSRYEPSVASQVIEGLLAQERDLTVIRKSRILESQGVRKTGARIESITLDNGQAVRAKVFVDASIEGHLIHLAGITTETIRGGNARYGEFNNGIRTHNPIRNFEIAVDPYQVPGDPSSGLLPTIQDEPLGEAGQPSKYVMGFCFRMVLTRDPYNRLPVEKPPNYDRYNYEIYRRYFEAGGRLFKPYVNRPNGKTDLGSWHDLSANLYGENWEYPAGDYETQARIVRYHRDFTQGLFWFLQNDPEVPPSTKRDWAGWGLCKDEFIDNGGWPRRLYIRSARRLVSDFVHTEHHTMRSNDEEIPDPVAIAWWPPDAHHARRIVRDGAVYNEGFTHVGGNHWRPFGVSWRSLIPQSAECTNLITPTCPSSSYIAYGSIRILPTFMVLGQSAATAASLAIDQGVTVQSLDYQLIRERLDHDGQILDIPENWEEIVNQN